MCKIEQIGKTGRELKIRTKEHKAASKEDSKLHFLIESGKEKEDKLSNLPEHLKKEKHQLDWNSIKVLSKENNTIENADRKKRISLLNTGYVSAFK